MNIFLLNYFVTSKKSAIRANTKFMAIFWVMPILYNKIIFVIALVMVMLNMSRKIPVLISF